MTFLIQQTLVYTIPLMIVALAGVFAERSGIINIALDGIMIFGSFVGAFSVYIMQRGNILADNTQLMYVIAMLIGLIALIHLIDWILGGIGTLIVKYLHINSFIGLDLANLSLKMILGKIFAIFAFLMGVPMAEATTVGSLMGTKLVLNEMVAYVDLVNLPEALSPKSFLIASFALCSFGNVGSIATQIGGIGELAPNQKRNLAELGFKALIAGTLTCFMSGTIAGILF